MTLRKKFHQKFKSLIVDTQFFFQKLIQLPNNFSIEMLRFVLDKR